MSKLNGRYCFRQDQDAHWYLIPAELNHLFDEWDEAVTNDQEHPEDFIGYMLAGGIERYSFEYPQENL